MGYTAAAVLCVRASFSPRQGTHSEDKTGWRLIALALMLLGLNKQLDLQTWLIDYGRGLAQAEGWYPYRRAVQAGFLAVFGLSVIGALIIVRRKVRNFFAAHPVAAAGLVMLAAFIVLRAGALNHIFHFGQKELDDEKWSWILEVMGIGTISGAAFQATLTRNDAAQRRMDTNPHE